MHQQHQPRNGEVLANHQTSCKRNLQEHAVPMITEGFIPNEEKGSGCVVGGKQTGLLDIALWISLS